MLCIATNERLRARCGPPSGWATTESRRIPVGEAEQGRSSSHGRATVFAISATPTDGWTTLAFTPARVFVPTASAWLRVTDSGSGPGRRERGSRCRSSRNPRYSVRQPTFFGHTAGVWSPTPTPLPCARHAGHGQASLRMATGDRDGRSRSWTAGHGGSPISTLPAVPTQEYGLPSSQTTRRL
jgi:hypothetical protein